MSCFGLARSRRILRSAASVEALESRRLLTVFMVTNAGDNGGVDPAPLAGTGTLRQAIVDSNADTAATNAIHFAISTGLQSIEPVAALPTITQPVIIDGTSQPGFDSTSHVPIIELDGESGGAGLTGLTITAGGSTVRGLIINLFTGEGINLSTKGADTIAGNYIGTDATGTEANPNIGDGVTVGSGNGDTIGGTDIADRNLISGNLSAGLLINASNNNLVEGNFIGTDASGANPLGNANGGVSVSGAATNNTIGGLTAGSRNIISGNAFGGIEFHGSNSTGNLVEGNYIGTDAAGAKAIPNLDEGIDANDGNTIGGTAPGAGNVISGNTGDGIDLGPKNTVEGNFIGVDATGNSALGNSQSGINAQGVDSTIGGAEIGAGNVISGNGQAGIILFADSNVVQGNRIGTNAAGTAPIPNLVLGIIVGATSNLIGGLSAGDGNLIAYNDGAGIAVTSGHANSILSNSIYSNGLLGIDLGGDLGDGPTPNDPGDADTGANNLQNMPTLTSASSTGVDTTVAGSLSSTKATTYVLQFFADPLGDPSGFGEGRTLLGSTYVETDISGNVAFNADFPVPIPAGQHVSATATAVNFVDLGPLDTSEFSNEVTVSGPPPVVSIDDVSVFEGNSGTTAATFTVSLSGASSVASIVSFTTADGTANEPSDYLAQSGLVTFLPGQTSKPITVTINGDTAVEPTETFVVNLTAVSNAIIDDGQGVGTIKNDDSAPPPPAPSSGSVTLVTDPTDSTKTALDIQGTNNADTITVTKSGSSQGKAVVKINGVNKGTFSFTGIILVYGNAGSDNISIDSAITRSAWIWGGDGDDTVTGGGGADMIFGQAGNDSLNGNAGRDILIGGDGTDKLNGGSGDDVLIAGDFKTTPTMSQLISIQKEWTRTDKSYTYRVNHLTIGGGFNTIKLSSSTLFSSTTLKDSLTGGADSDLFFAATTGDKVTDKSSSETVVNIG